MRDNRVRVGGFRLRAHGLALMLDFQSVSALPANLSNSYPKDIHTPKPQ